MKNYLILLFLIAYAICASKKSISDNTHQNSELKSKMFDCILKADGISKDLRNSIEDIKNSNQRMPLQLNKLQKGDKDIEIIRNCKKAVLKEYRAGK